jgi:predicted DNA-binding transcriptional regulator YafY
MKIDRLLSIVVLLLGREKVRAGDLARRFEVTVRTIYRDLDTINASGIPIVAYPGPGGGFAVDPSYTIDRRLLGFDDIKAIVSALKGVNTALGDKAIGAALEKIESLGPRSRAPEFLEDRVVIDLFPWGRREEERRLVRALEPAIAERRLVSFTYSSYGAKAERRVVEPMTLVFKAYAWYLWGYCRLRGDYRLFKLSRIRELSTSLERFKRRPASYSREAEPPKPPDVGIIIRVDRARASEAWEWFGASEAEPEEDGALRIAVRVPEGGWFINTLLGFGPGIEVIEPESVRRAYSEAAAGIAAANAGAPLPPTPPPPTKIFRSGDNS